MGRVDDAMRRATEARERGKQTEPVEPAAVLEADETDSPITIFLSSSGLGLRDRLVPRRRVSTRRLLKRRRRNPRRP